MTTTIYIQLLEEGTTVYRPTQAQALDGQLFRVLPTPGYDGDDEIWEFAPGSLVYCDAEVKQGETVLIARRLVRQS